VTPFEATFGYDPRVPLWEGVKYPGVEIVERKDFAEYLAEVKHTQLRTREIAHHNNQQVRQEYKDKYDAELRLTGRNATQLTLHFRFHVSLVTNRLLTRHDVYYNPL
jgi:hypothetical protein